MTFLQWHLLSLKMAGTAHDVSSSSTINQLVCGLMENPHFLDLLERTSRRINSPQWHPNRPPRAAPQAHGPFRRLWRNLGLFLEPERHRRHLYLDSTQGGQLGCHLRIIYSSWWGFSTSPQTNWLMVEEDNASWPVPGIFHESKCHCKNVIAAISAFFPRAFFPTPPACSHLFAGTAGRSTQRHNVYLHVMHNVYVCYVS